MRVARRHDRLRGIGLACFLLAPAASCQEIRQPAGEKPTRQGANAVIEIVKSNGQADPPKVGYSPVALTDGSAPSRERASVQSPGYVRALSGPAQNSRSPGVLPAGQWTLRWNAPLSAPAVATLVSGDRILLQQGGGWTLFARDGKRITEGSAGRAAITIDSRTGMFFSLGPGIMLQATALENGELRFKVPLGHNESFAWPLLYRSGARLIAAATEQKMFSPKGYPPTQSLIQSIELGSPPRLSPYKLLLSINSQEELVFKEPNMLPVASADILWAVLPNLLIRTSPTQQIGGAWTDSFEPVAASTDEAGWLYLIAGLGERRELWIVAPDGRRTVRTELSSRQRAVAVPPAVGYDHRVFLWTSEAVSAFSAEGKHLWDFQGPGGVTGLTVTPNGFVVVAAGNKVHLVGETGQAVAVVEIGERITSAPVVTAEGELLVSGETKLFCYAIQK